jgi:hypothetical protein
MIFADEFAELRMGAEAAGTVQGITGGRLVGHGSIPPGLIQRERGQAIE